MEKNKTITVSTTVNKPALEVWEKFTNPTEITNWNFAIPEWHSPSASSDLVPGGKFNYRMEARDGSMGFDFTGTFDEIEEGKRLTYTLDDGRKAEILFDEKDGVTTITENFEAEASNPADMQQQGWQAILNNFKKYAE